MASEPQVPALGSVGGGWGEAQPCLQATCLMEKAGPGLARGRVLSVAGQNLGVGPGVTGEKPEQFRRCGPQARVWACVTARALAGWSAEPSVAWGLMRERCRQVVERISHLSQLRFPGSCHHLSLPLPPPSRTIPP